MPLWLALLFEKRNLASISTPAWLSVDHLKSVLEWEQTKETFSPALPYYWQPLARHLGTRRSGENFTPGYCHGAHG